MGKIIHATGTRPLPPSDPRDRAHAQAERIIKDAMRQALRLQQAARSQGHLSGFCDGFERGWQDAKSQGYKAGLGEAGGVVTATTELLGRLARTVETQSDDLHQDIERLRLALAKIQTSQQAGEAGKSQAKKQPPSASFDEDAPLVASARGKVVHLRECRHARSITPDNGISFDSLDAVTAAGLSFCRACQPEEKLRPAPPAASDDAAGA